MNKFLDSLAISILIGFMILLWIFLFFIMPYLTVGIEGIIEVHSILFLALVINWSIFRIIKSGIYLDD